MKPVKPIRLIPSTSDYATFVKTTNRALGITSGPLLSKTRPNLLILELSNSLDIWNELKIKK